MQKRIDTKKMMDLFGLKSGMTIPYPMPTGILLSEAAIAYRWLSYIPQFPSSTIMACVNNKVIGGETVFRFCNTI